MSLTGRANDTSITPPLDVLQYCLGNPNPNYASSKGIPVEKSGYVNIAEDGVEWRLQDPTFTGQLLLITRPGAEAAVKADSPITPDGRQLVVFKQPDACCLLIGIELADKFIWRVVFASGAAIT